MVYERIDVDSTPRPTIGCYVGHGIPTPFSIRAGSHVLVNKTHSVYLGRISCNPKTSGQKRIFIESHQQKFFREADPTWLLVIQWLIFAEL